MFQVEKSIKALCKSIKEMTKVVSTMVGLIENAIQNEEWKQLEEIYKYDKKLDQLEMSTDQIAIELLALINPRAKDLRFVFSAIKLDVDLERIGDECKNVAQQLSRIKGETPKELKDLAKQVKKMVDQCFKALLKNDATIAKKVILSDDKADELEYKIITKYPNSIDIAFAARALERIADHATNIAEKVVFNVEGIDVRHENSIQNRKSTSKI